MIDKTDDLIEALYNYDYSLAYRILDDYSHEFCGCHSMICDGSCGIKKPKIDFNKIMRFEYVSSKGEKYGSDTNIESFISSPKESNKFSEREKTILLCALARCYKSDISDLNDLIKKIKEILC